MTLTVIYELDEVNGEASYKGLSNIGENDALPFEYKMSDWQPRRQVDISYFIGDAASLCFHGAQESHSKEQFIDSLSSQ